MCAFEHCWWHTHVHGCVHTHVHSWWDGCNCGKVCSGKEATRHLTWGEPLASCAAAAQLLLRLLERSAVVAADGIRLIRYYQPASDWGCNEAAGSWCTQVHLGGELPHVCLCSELELSSQLELTLSTNKTKFIQAWISWHCALHPKSGWFHWKFPLDFYWLSEFRLICPFEGESIGNVNSY